MIPTLRRLEKDILRLNRRIWSAKGPSSRATSALNTAAVNTSKDIDLVRLWFDTRIDGPRLTKKYVDKLTVGWWDTGLRQSVAYTYLELWRTYSVLFAPSKRDSEIGCMLTERKICPLHVQNDGLSLVEWEKVSMHLGLPARDELNRISFVSDTRKIGIVWYKRFETNSGEKLMTFNELNIRY